MGIEQRTARLLLVRHGESQVMTKGIVGGPKTCSGLSDLGRAQARALRDRFAAGNEPAVDLVYASPLARAKETTEIVLPALGFPSDHEVLIHDELEEMRLWPADGMSWDAARKAFDFVQPAQRPYAPVIAGAESRASFRMRVANVLHEIAERHPGSTIFIGCHGGVVSSAMAMAFGISPAHPGVGVTTKLTSITEIDLLTDGDHQRWQVRRFNDAAHLAGVAVQVEPLDTTN